MMEPLQIDCTYLIRQGEIDCPKGWKKGGDISFEEGTAVCDLWLEMVKQYGFLCLLLWEKFLKASVQTYTFLELNVIRFNIISRPMAIMCRFDRVIDLLSRMCFYYLHKNKEVPEVLIVLRPIVPSSGYLVFYIQWFFSSFFK